MPNQTQNSLQNSDLDQEENKNQEQLLKKIRNNPLHFQIYRLINYIKKKNKCLKKLLKKLKKNHL
ncbi:hypothetical protein KAR28_01180 [Candidatus Parcubacteria bacterium]|nr:hypothetical protein [Candidatus Parcubacteria bacterium]